jgi:transcriptional regulator with XRE-family HTH domain
MASSHELSEFLRSRRARLSPADVGLRGNAGRRVAGLRREELAMLAGVSADYYARLEQGRARNVSDSVLSAVADALRLDDVERRHLVQLVRPATAGRADGDKPVRARAALRSMIYALDPTPALLYGPRLDVLAVNRVGAVLLDDFEAMPAADRNMIRWMFLNPKAREVYPDWAEIAAQLVAVLRLEAGPNGDDRRLAALVRELGSQSAEFAKCWADHRVYQHTHGPKRLRHRAVGEMTLNYETLIPPGDPQLRVIVYTADIGSPAAEKLNILKATDKGR